MNVKGGLKVSIIVFVSGLMVGFPVSCCPNIRETLTIGNIYSYRFFSGAILLRFAWLFRDSGKARSPKPTS
jgi:hypothetical protein